LIGASDGFNLSNENADMNISIFGLVSKLFLKGLKQKVMRGMLGAADRGGVMSKLPLGLTRLPQRDQRGNVVCDSLGLPVYRGLR
jgi:hypothetical protein